MTRNNVDRKKSDCNEGDLLLLDPWLQKNDF